MERGDREGLGRVERCVREGWGGVLGRDGEVC